MSWVSGSWFHPGPVSAIARNLGSELANLLNLQLVTIFAVLPSALTFQATLWCKHLQQFFQTRYPGYQCFALCQNGITSVSCLTASLKTEIWVDILVLCTVLQAMLLPSGLPGFREKSTVIWSPAPLKVTTRHCFPGCSRRIMCPGMDFFVSVLSGVCLASRSMPLSKRGRRSALILQTHSQLCTFSSHSGTLTTRTLHLLLVFHRPVGLCSFLLSLFHMLQLDNFRYFNFHCWNFHLLLLCIFSVFVILLTFVSRMFPIACSSVCTRFLSDFYISVILSLAYDKTS